MTRTSTLCAILLALSALLPAALGQPSLLGGVDASAPPRVAHEAAQDAESAATSALPHVVPSPVRACTLGHEPVICPTACSDYQDNDHDGYTDMNDPGCSSPEDDDEYNCEWSYRWATADIWVTTAPVGTEVWEETLWRYGCPGGPQFVTDYRDCDAWNDWYNSACYYWDPPNSWGSLGYFFHDGESMRTLAAAVTLLDNSGSFTCQFDWTPGLSVGTDCKLI